MGYKKLLFVGRSQTGKDTFCEYLENGCGLRKAMSHTSRPKREYEVDGEHYFFVSHEEFLKMDCEDRKFIEVQDFNNWFYGLSYDEFEKADLLILTPVGVDALLENPNIKRDELLIVLIDVHPGLRYERALRRNDTHDSMHRRWFTDDIDFMDFDNYGGPWDMKICIQNDTAITDFTFEIIKNLIKV